MSRMKLRELQDQLSLAKRGHDLLKEKQDTMMRIFMENVQKSELLRKELTIHFVPIRNAYYQASLNNSQAKVAKQLDILSQEFILTREQTMLYGEEVPKFHMGKKEATPLSEEKILALDESLLNIMDKRDSLMETLIVLAEEEKRLMILGERIRQTRRRVNALKYRSIPNLEEEIKTLSLKLDDQERSQKARIMKRLNV